MKKSEFCKPVRANFASNCWVSLKILSLNLVMKQDKITSLNRSALFIDKMLYYAYRRSVKFSSNENLSSSFPLFLGGIYIEKYAVPCVQFFSKSN